MAQILKDLSQKNILIMRFLLIKIEFKLYYQTYLRMQLIIQIQVLFVYLQKLNRINWQLKLLTMVLVSLLKIKIEFLNDFIEKMQIDHAKRVEVV